IQQLLKELAIKHGALFVVVAQPKTIGALVIAVAQHLGAQVAYLPGLTMRRVADVSPGQDKADARDASVIETARTMPHTAAGHRSRRTDRGVVDAMWV